MTNKIRKFIKLNQYLMLSFILIFSGCNSTLKGQNEKKNQPNIIWITIEDLSPEFLGFYGNKLVQTPNLDALRAESVKYMNVHTVAGVCSVSRSAIITGMYPTSIGTQNHSILTWHKNIPSKIEGLLPIYSAVIPPNVKCFTEYLRMNGYYCANNEKEDYQFVPPVTAWDESSAAATYQNRKEGQPFFSIFNFGITHESQLFMREGKPLTVFLDNVIVPTIFQNTPTVHKDLARLLTNVEIVDKQIGELIKRLKEDGVYDSSYIFFYSDHGGAMPWYKREITERGTHIPMLVKFPKGDRAGTVNNELISEIDFAPTVLSLASIEPPSYLQGQCFLGKYKSRTPRKYVFATRDRMDGKYDRVRSVRNADYQYIYNYFPDRTYYQDIEFRKKIATLNEMLELRDQGKLDPIPMSWFNKKPVEEFYRISDDPYQLNNLINDRDLQGMINEFRESLQDWDKKYPDLGKMQELDMIKQMWSGADERPHTAIPKVVKTKSGFNISCATDGASIGYKILKKGENDNPIERIVNSWCIFTTVGEIKNGQSIKVSSPWKVYTNNLIQLEAGDKLLVNAHRIGYDPAIIVYDAN